MHHNFPVAFHTLQHMVKYPILDVLIFQYLENKLGNIKALDNLA